MACGMRAVYPQKGYPGSDQGIREVKEVDMDWLMHSYVFWLVVGTAGGIAVLYVAEQLKKKSK